METFVAPGAPDFSHRSGLCNHLRGSLSVSTFSENHATPLSMALPFSPTLLLLALLCGLALPGCETLNPAQRRASRNPELFASLSQKEKNLVDQGRIEEGMSRDAVYLAWGRPGRVMSGSRNGQGREKWAYFHTAPVQTTSIGFGGFANHPFYANYGFHPAFGYGFGPGWGMSTGIDYLPYIGSTVEFFKGRVVAWERAD